jgi:hypothetical protein
MSGQTPKRRHKWEPWSEAPTRDDYRKCAHCPVVRVDYNATRYEYRGHDWQWLGNRPKYAPAPPCQPSKENPHEQATRETDR